MNEQTQFKIDTSGYVHKAPYDPINGWPGCYRWSDLSPFQQGAVEALFQTEVTHGEQRWVSPLRDIRGFSDLSASALQRIMADCERFQKLTREVYGVEYVSKPDGRWFWETRQTGKTSSPSLEDFPPLTISLAEDGLIHLSEVG